MNHSTHHKEAALISANTGHPAPAFNAAVSIARLLTASLGFSPHLDQGEQYDL